MLGAEISIALIGQLLLHRWVTKPAKFVGMDGTKWREGTGKTLMLNHDGDSQVIDSRLARQFGRGVFAAVCKEPALQLGFEWLCGDRNSKVTPRQ